MGELLIAIGELLEALDEIFDWPKQTMYAENQDHIKIKGEMFMLSLITICGVSLSTIGKICIASGAVACAAKKLMDEEDWYNAKYV